MRIAIIGRSENLYKSAQFLAEKGHTIELIITAKEAPEYTKGSEDFRKLAEDLGARFIHSPKIRPLYNEIQALDLDVGISMNYVDVVDQETIDLFKYGILNAHGGDLPRYRGNACQAWALLNGESKIGLCIHKMIGGELDSGDIIARNYYPIDINSKIREVYDWIYEQMPILFNFALARLTEDPSYVLEVQSLDPKKILRTYPRCYEDGRIHWASERDHIVRLVNASGPPYEGAFCYYKGKKMTILDAAVLDHDEKFLAIPGQVTTIGDGFVDVVAGNMKKLRVLKVVFEGELGAPNQFIKSIRSRLS
ncbi:methionyl-tRNA formyltransferase [Terasakiella pusilla]|uniref:methionyl-tRNA formyltransferase n=1 Tax=Terasakiella pusilla TaxID=64973 RepID=UPI003AA8D6ED